MPNGWNKRLPITTLGQKCPLACMSRYEDFVEDIFSEAEKINKFLGLPLELQDIKSVG